MKEVNRRQFVKQTGAATAGLIAVAPLLRTGVARASANDTINVAVLCDIDERLFPKALANVEEIAGKRPKTETDIRRVLENKEIDVVSIAAPNHWHALGTIWACQAGKDVYVEKPCSYSVWEGRKMVEAARKYNRIVQHGT